MNIESKGEYTSINQDAIIEYEKLIISSEGRISNPRLLIVVCLAWKHVAIGMSESVMEETLLYSKTAPNDGIIALACRDLIEYGSHSETSSFVIDCTSLMRHNISAPPETAALDNIENDDQERCG
jgi:hypothetical protein